MKEQTRVNHKKSGRMGTICPTSQFLQEDGPWSVVYDGTTVSVTLLAAGGEEAFEVIGPENAVADPKKCGAGLGAKCCIFLTAGTGGFNCERFSSLRESLQFRSMTAKREPSEPFPICQIGGKSARHQD